VVERKKKPWEFVKAPRSKLRMNENRHKKKYSGVLLTGISVRIIRKLKVVMGEVSAKEGSGVS